MKFCHFSSSLPWQADMIFKIQSPVRFYFGKDSKKEPGKGEVIFTKKDRFFIFFYLSQNFSLINTG